MQNARTSTEIRSQFDQFWQNFQISIEILQIFGVDLGMSEVLRASAGAGRGALLTKSTFSASATGSESILSLPRRSLGALWPSLSALWGEIVASEAPLRVPRAPSEAFGASLEALLGVSWTALGPS